MNLSIVYPIIFIGALIYFFGQMNFERISSGLNMPLFVALCAVICAFGLTLLWHCGKSTA